MAYKTEREAEASSILRTELVKREITYKNLARMLAAQGTVESETQLKSKISRGKFSFHFFLLVMRAIGVKTISFDTGYVSELHESGIVRVRHHPERGR